MPFPTGGGGVPRSGSPRNSAGDDNRGHMALAIWEFAPVHCLSSVESPTSIRGLPLSRSAPATRRYNKPNGSVLVTLLLEGNEAVLCVRDTGIGIPAESLPHVFDRFYRVDAARSRADGGSGLGLSICQAVVRGHQGTITIESQIDEGTAITVRLPALVESAGQ